MAFSLQISPLERFALRDSSKFLLLYGPLLIARRKVTRPAARPWSDPGPNRLPPQSSLQSVRAEVMGEVWWRTEGAGISILRCCGSFEAEDEWMIPCRLLNHCTSPSGLTRGVALADIVLIIAPFGVCHASRRLLKSQGTERSAQGRG